MSSFSSIELSNAVIDDLRLGHVDALTQIYRSFERPVFNLAWRLLGDRDEAQEVLHDAMLQVIEKINQYRNEAPFWAWLRQICVNVTLTRIRRQRLDYVDELPEPESAIGLFESVLDHADLEAALNRLPTATRSVIWLYYVEGYTHEEIAHAFQKTLSFSKSQISRGTEKLRNLLDVDSGKKVYA